MGRIVGIDLGTTTSEIAYIKNGKPEIIKNGYSSITPSIVGLDKNFNVIVGIEAKNQMVTAMDRTVVEVKRKMGTNETVVMAGKKFTPVEISTIILKELKRVGEEYLHETIDRAVITVPANFDDAQRQATKEAGEKAGFKVERIINEPTAAALAFGIDNMETEGKILVYDLGGGTFDVTVLEMIEGSLDVRASRGINKLGGKDFDEAIVEEMLLHLQKEYQLDIEKDLAVQDRVRVLGRIKEEAEKAKISLSLKENVEIDIPWLAQKDGESINFEMELTRNRYEELISKYVKQTIEVVDEALEAANMSREDIDIVLAVGGSSKTPLVRETLTEFFGKKIKGGINHDEAVALGAAVQAGIISKEISGNDSIVIFDVCNHTLGTSVNNKDKTGLEYSRIIMRDTHLPFAMTRRYITSEDFQREVDVDVYQGESDDLSENRLLGAFTVAGIPENYAGREALDIEFRYNLDGILDVNVTVVSTGKVTSAKYNMFEYDPPKTKSEEKMDDLLTGVWTQASEIKTTVMLYQNRRAGLPDVAKQRADELMKQLKQAVVENDAKKIEEIDDNLTALLFEY